MLCLFGFLTDCAQGGEVWRVVGVGGGRFHKLMLIDVLIGRYGLFVNELFMRLLLDG
jgi:hypothetical protein